MINLRFENAEFDYEPYPICYIPNFLDEDLYKKLCDTYPDQDLFSSEIYAGKKFALSEIINNENYYKFLDNNEHWKEFFNRIKTKEFVEEVFQFLRDNNIDLRVNKFRYTPNINKKQSKLLSAFSKKPTMKTRFEFSSLPANDGAVYAHTDVPAKMVTFVISFMHPGEWQQEWGGGTEVVMPKDRTLVYNQSNFPLPVEEVDVLKTFPFVPNQAVLFIKTYNSWHAVHPMTGPEGKLRKTVTLNIERVSS